MRRFLLIFIFWFSLLNLYAQSKSDLRLEIERLKTDSINQSDLIARQVERLESLQQYGGKLLSDNIRLRRDSIHLVRRIEECEFRLGDADIERQEFVRALEILHVKMDSLNGVIIKLSNSDSSYEWIQNKDMDNLGVVRIVNVKYASIEPFRGLDHYNFVDRNGGYWPLNSYALNDLENTDFLNEDNFGRCFQFLYCFKKTEELVMMDPGFDLILEPSGKYVYDWVLIDVFEGPCYD